MLEFIETIRIEQGIPRNLKFHNYRFNKTRFDHFGDISWMDLAGVLSGIGADMAYAKCRVRYNKHVLEVEVEPYAIRPIKSLKCIEGSRINYGYKYADRRALDKLFLQRAECDDILVIQNDRITDTYYANVALVRNGLYFTPEKPLLKGTMRHNLLKTGKIIPADLHINTIQRYEYVTLFNAMIPIDTIKIPVRQVVV